MDFDPSLVVEPDTKYIIFIHTCATFVQTYITLVPSLYFFSSEGILQILDPTEPLRTP